MHEVSVIEEIVEQVKLEIGKYPGAKLDTVNLQVGKLRQFVPEIMSFCYDVTVKDSELEGSRLIVNEIPINIRCKSCGQETELEVYDFHCPACESWEVEMLTGNELILDSLQMTRPEETNHGS